MLSAFMLMTRWVRVEQIGLTNRRGPVQDRMQRRRGSCTACFYRKEALLTYKGKGRKKIIESQGGQKCPWKWMLWEGQSISKTNSILIFAHSDNDSSGGRKYISKTNETCDNGLQITMAKRGWEMGPLGYWGYFFWKGDLVVSSHIVNSFPKNYGQSTDFLSDTWPGF